MTVFAVVIAIAKDLPDVAGDRQYKVRLLYTLEIAHYPKST